MILFIDSCNDAEDPTNYRCTVCRENVVKSVSYCVSCDKKLCPHHEQVCSGAFYVDRYDNHLNQSDLRTELNAVRSNKVVNAGSVVIWISRAS